MEVRPLVLWRLYAPAERNVREVGQEWVQEYTHRSRGVWVEKASTLLKKEQSLEM